MSSNRQKIHFDECDGNFLEPSFMRTNTAGQVVLRRYLTFDWCSCSRPLASITFT